LRRNGGALIVGEPAAGAAGHDHVAGIGPLQQAGGMQKGRLADTRRRHQGHHFAGRQGEIGARQNCQLARPLNIVALDALELDDRLRHHRHS